MADRTLEVILKLTTGQFQAGAQAAAAAAPRFNVNLRQLSAVKVDLSQAQTALRALKQSADPGALRAAEKAYQEVLTQRPRLVTAGVKAQEVEQRAAQAAAEALISAGAKRAGYGPITDTDSNPRRYR